MTRLARTRLTRAQQRARPGTRADHAWTLLTLALCFLVAVAIAVTICLQAHTLLASHIGEGVAWIVILILAILLLFLFVVLSFGAQWVFNFAYRDLRDFQHPYGDAHLFEKIAAWCQSRRPYAPSDG